MRTSVDGGHGDHGAVRGRRLAAYQRLDGADDGGGGDHGVGGEVRHRAVPAAARDRHVERIGRRHHRARLRQRYMACSYNVTVSYKGILCMVKVLSMVSMQEPR